MTKEPLVNGQQLVAPEEPGASGIPQGDVDDTKLLTQFLDVRRFVLLAVFRIFDSHNLAGPSVLS